MKVLVAHVRYRSRGGEDQVFEDEVGLLRSAGIDVSTLDISSFNLRALGVKAGLSIALSRGDHEYGRALIRDAITSLRPDVVHFHNLYPLLGVGAMREARDAGCLVVRTLHNYRLSCIAGTHFYAGSICERCAPRRRLAGIIRGCYRGSRAQSTMMAAACETEWRSLTEQGLPQAVICQTPFARQKLVAYGAPDGRVAVKANSVDPAPAFVPAAERSGAVFVGRLSLEKGVDRLVQAWSDELPPLTVLGDGPLRGPLAEHRSSTVRLVGSVERAEARRYMSRARVLVVPSLAYEGDPLAIIEAFASGTPVVCFAHGPLAAIGEELSTDCVVPTGDFRALVLAAVRVLRMSQPEWVVLSNRATAVYRRDHTQERSLAGLLQVYEDAAASDSHGRQRGERD